MPAQTTATVADDSQSLNDWLIARQQNIAAKIQTTPVAADDKPQINVNIQNLKQDVSISPEEKKEEKLINPLLLKAADELTRADIFKLLGMSNITEGEKKKNLDEMEETIWADFVEQDLPQMLEGEKKERFLDLLKTAPSAEKIINFFGSPPSGGLPPNFEEKYLAKTLQFKAEIVKEQIDTLLAATGGDAKKQELLKTAKAAIDAGEWKKAEEIMERYL